MKHGHDAYATTDRRKRGRGQMGAASLTREGGCHAGSAKDAKEEFGDAECGVWSERLTEENVESAEKKWQERS